MNTPDPYVATCPRVLLEVNRDKVDQCLLEQGHGAEFQAEFGQKPLVIPAAR